MKFKLGKKYKDKVTGLGGVAIGCTTYLTGCDVYGLQYVKDNEIATIWVDEGRIEAVKSKPIEAKAKRNGGPHHPVPKKGY